MNLKFNENQLWMTLMVFTPIMSFVIPELSTIIGLLGSVIGGVVGFLLYNSNKSKSRLIKSLVLVVIMCVCMLVICFFREDKNNINQSSNGWNSYILETVRFKSPSPLIKTTNTAFNDSIFEKMVLYTDENEDKATFCLIGNLKTDSINLKTLYSLILEQLLEKDSSLFVSNFTYQDEEELSVVFTCNREGYNFMGYSAIFKKENSIRSVWLIPINESFTENYIATFDDNISF
tara:strand:+ start:77 stop:775 length:699 start_codon:yes stop_codon:yes gene_type:complete